MIGGVGRKTTNFGFNLINYDFPSWHEYEWQNWQAIDAIINLSLNSFGVKGIWDNSIAVQVGDRYVDADSSTVWQALVSHITPATGSFTAARLLNPTYWKVLTTVPVNRGTWAEGVFYSNGDIVSFNNVYKLCVAQHTSTAGSFADVTKWTTVFDASSAIAACNQAVSDAQAAAQSLNISSLVTKTNGVFNNTPKVGEFLIYHEGNLPPVPPAPDLTPYIKRDGSVAMTSSLTFSTLSSGPVLALGGKMADTSTGGAGNNGRTAIYANNDSLDIVSKNGATVLGSWQAAGFYPQVTLYAKAANSTMANGDSSSTLQVRNGGGTGDSGMAMMSFLCTGSYGIKLGLRADGVFGLGGWTSATWRWYVDAAGNMVAAGNVGMQSDRKLKTNLVQLRGSLDKIKQLTGYVYDRIDTGERQIGVVAQDVEVVQPELVNENNDIKTVAYANMAALFVEALKEIDARLTALETTHGIA